MRNIFDQYTCRENRISHALAVCLSKDQFLLRSFIRWLIGKPIPPAKNFYVTEQSLPGKDESLKECEGDKGLPDIWIYDEDKEWAILIESKVDARASLSQLQRHFKTARRLRFSKVTLVLITARESSGGTPGIVQKEWEEVYDWAGQQKSSWAKDLRKYFEIAEQKMIDEGYLKEGAMTRFSGIPFLPEEPYEYGEAKRLIRLLTKNLKSDKAFVKNLSIDPDLPGRPGIKGQQSSYVWDVLRLKGSPKNFTTYPHLTIVIGAEDARAVTIIPNSVKTKIRNRIIDGSYERFKERFERFLVGAEDVIRYEPSVKPFLDIVQRHYPSMSAPPIEDARMTFDLRASFNRTKKSKEKYQPQWLASAYEIYSNKRSNIQMALGFKFPYAKSSRIRTSDSIALFKKSFSSMSNFLKSAIE
jgi:hypothetical protein